MFRVNSERFVLISASSKSVWLEKASPVRSGSITSGEQGGDGEESDDLGDSDVMDFGVPDNDLRACMRLVVSAL